MADIRNFLKIYVFLLLLYDEFADFFMVKHVITLPQYNKNTIKKHGPQIKARVSPYLSITIAPSIAINGSCLLI